MTGSRRSWEPSAICRSIVLMKLRSSASRSSLVNGLPIPRNQGWMGLGAGTDKHGRPRQLQGLPYRPACRGGSPSVAGVLAAGQAVAKVADREGQQRAPSAHIGDRPPWLRRPDGEEMWRECSAAPCSGICVGQNHSSFVPWMLRVRRSPLWSVCIARHAERCVLQDLRTCPLGRLAHELPQIVPGPQPTAMCAEFQRIQTLCLHRPCGVGQLGQRDKNPGTMRVLASPVGVVVRLPSPEMADGIEDPSVDRDRIRCQRLRALWRQGGP